jgi:hypothetical protein
MIRQVQVSHHASSKQTCVTVVSQAPTFADQPLVAAAVSGSSLWSRPRWTWFGAQAPRAHFLTRSISTLQSKVEIWVCHQIPMRNCVVSSTWQSYGIGTSRSLEYHNGESCRRCSRGQDRRLKLVNYHRTSSHWRVSSNVESLTVPRTSFFCTDFTNVDLNRPCRISLSTDSIPTQVKGTLYLRQGQWSIRYLRPWFVTFVAGLWLSLYVCVNGADHLLFHWKMEEGTTIPTLTPLLRVLTVPKELSDISSSVVLCIWSCKVWYAVDQGPIANFPFNSPSSELAFSMRVIGEPG